MPHCLNCHETISKEASFCFHCGARVVKNRITLKRILSEIAETIFGWDNKYLFTARLLVVRPHIVLEEYTKGVRKKYVHPFTYLIIGATLVLFSFTLFLDNFMEHLQAFSEKMKDLYGGAQLKDTQKVQREIIEYFNITTLILIPVYSLFTYFIYRKTYNYAEHLVFNSYIQGTSFIFIFVFFYISLLTHPLVYSITTFITFFLYIYSFGKLFKLDLGTSILKFFLFIVLFSAFIIILMALLIAIVFLLSYLNN
ncbi:DUF3667 domain-containing protein [Flagellimonas sp. HMM57]|uniref:DUF3667 domain-containing protein n=1 Tax=unclassified Flagellimonas TaxID=2644544 RepID=UPI0013D6B28A|nr:MULTISPECIES: DUF3667 domain-containing protein [unclassified Flagellimonas]UII74492.1 DUF3667 domain-containing protein [Flagellimonas sp. HMM57]